MIIRWFNWLFLCKIAKKHPWPDDLQLMYWFEDRKSITCLTCGKEYHYDEDWHYR